MHDPPSQNDLSRLARKIKPGLDGLLVIDKPGGMTSRDVVNRAQGWFPRRARIGHAGTLDPLATGVLVLCIGRATRLIEYVQRLDKEYRAGIAFGARSDTDDAAGAITPVDEVVVPDKREVLEALTGFIGIIEQTPPAYSAAKITGRRAYDLARRGQSVDLRPRPVRIDAIDVLAFEYPGLDVVIRCGKGTYIRALARDLGQRLGCGAYLESLRRTRIGPFHAGEACPLEITATEARAALLDIAMAVTGLSRVTLPDADLARLRQGQAVSLAACEPGEIAVFDARGGLAAIGACQAERNVLQPVKVL